MSSQLAATSDTCTYTGLAHFGFVRVCLSAKKRTTQQKLKEIPTEQIVPTRQSTMQRVGAKKFCMPTEGGGQNFPSMLRLLQIDSLFLVEGWLGFWASLRKKQQHSSQMCVFQILFVQISPQNIAVNDFYPLSFLGASVF